MQLDMITEVLVSEYKEHLLAEFTEGDITSGRACRVVLKGIAGTSYEGLDIELLFAVVSGRVNKQVVGIKVGEGFNLKTGQSWLTELNRDIARVTKAEDDYFVEYKDKSFSLNWPLFEEVELVDDDGSITLLKDIGLSEDEAVVVVNGNEAIHLQQTESDVGDCTVVACAPPSVLTQNEGGTWDIELTGHDRNLNIRVFKDALRLSSSSNIQNIQQRTLAISPNTLVVQPDLYDTGVGLQNPMIIHRLDENRILVIEISMDQFVYLKSQFPLAISADIYRTDRAVTSVKARKGPAASSSTQVGVRKPNPAFAPGNLIAANIHENNSDFALGDVLTVTWKEGVTEIDVSVTVTPGGLELSDEKVRVRGVRDLKEATLVSLDADLGVYTLKIRESETYAIKLGQFNVLLNTTPIKFSDGIPVDFVAAANKSDQILPKGMVAKIPDIEARSLAMKRQLDGSELPIRLHVDGVDISFLVQVLEEDVPKGHATYAVVSEEAQIQSVRGLETAVVTKSSQNSRVYHLTLSDGTLYKLYLTEANIYLYTTPLEETEKIPDKAIKKWVVDSRQAIARWKYYFGLARKKSKGNGIERLNPKLTANPKEQEDGYWQDIVYPDGEIFGVYVLGDHFSHMRFWSPGDDDLTVVENPNYMPQSGDRVTSLTVGVGNLDRFGVFLVYQKGYLGMLPVIPAVWKNTETQIARFNTLIKRMIDEYAEGIEGFLANHTDEAVTALGDSLQAKPHTEPFKERTISQPIFPRNAQVQVDTASLKQAIEILGRNRGNRNKKVPVELSSDDDRFTLTLKITHGSGKKPFEIAGGTYTAIDNETGEERLLQVISYEEKLEGVHNLLFFEALYDIDSGERYTVAYTNYSLGVYGSIRAFMQSLGMPADKHAELLADPDGFTMMTERRDIGVEAALFRTGIGFLGLED